MIATGERRRKLQRSALSLALCLVACADSNERDLPFAGKNIVLVVVDTLRADHLAPYGYEHDGKLYVVYSVGKEDCGLSVVPIESLAL